MGRVIESGRCRAPNNSLGASLLPPRIIMTKETDIMTAKYLKGSLALLVFSVLISVGTGAASARYSQAAPPQNGPADKSKPAAPPINKPEDDAFKAFLA